MCYCSVIVIPHLQLFTSARTACFYCVNRPNCSCVKSKEDKLRVEMCSLCGHCSRGSNFAEGCIIYKESAIFCCNNGQCEVSRLHLFCCLLYCLVCKFLLVFISVIEEEKIYSEKSCITFLRIHNHPLLSSSHSSPHLPSSSQCLAATTPSKHSHRRNDVPTQTVHECQQCPSSLVEVAKQQAVLPPRRQGPLLTTRPHITCRGPSRGDYVRLSP